MNPVYLILFLLVLFISSGLFNLIFLSKNADLKDKIEILETVIDMQERKINSLENKIQ
jgi:hypothetical protein